MLVLKRLYPLHSNNLIGKDSNDSYSFKNSNAYPFVNISEGKEDFMLELVVPGFEKSDFEIKVENKELKIKGNLNKHLNSSERKYSRLEFSTKSFEKTFELPEFVDIEKIDAHYQNGILLIKLLKKEEAKVKPAQKIEIN